MFKKLVLANGTVFGAGLGYTLYQYPDFRQDPRLVFQAYMRQLRVAKTGALMAIDYLRDPSFSPETHEKASKRLYDCFC